MLIQVLLTPGFCLYKIDSIDLVSDLHRYESEEIEIFWDVKCRLNTTKDETLFEHAVIGNINAEYASTFIPV